MSACYRFEGLLRVSDGVDIPSLQRWLQDNIILELLDEGESIPGDEGIGIELNWDSLTPTEEEY